jgi:large subunit ribosomal protein L15
MAQKDRKINTKSRGTRNCGWGNTQKHRGAGNRGGRGMAGSNKQKWSYVSKFMPDHFGRQGFKRPLKMIYDDVTINVGDLERKVDVFVSEGIAEYKDKKYVIDLTQLGYDKLLGAGKIKRPMEIKVEKSSDSAVEKVKAAGGNVLVSSAPEEKAAAK